jgi:hypothetical protein
MTSTTIAAQCRVYLLLLCMFLDSLVVLTTLVDLYFSGGGGGGHI